MKSKIHEYQNFLLKQMSRNKFQTFIKTILLLTVFCSVLNGFAQAPQKMSYQSIIRDTNDALVKETQVGIKISVLQGSERGIPVYIENHTVITNSNGLATLQIGTGTIEKGIFSEISWGTNSYYLKTETDPTGGSKYSIEGTSQLMSVPYALYAASSPESSWTSSGKDIGNANNGNVGIGTTTPVAKFEIKSSNQANPSNTDGLMIPKIDSFPLINPTMAQQGMMVYLTKATTFEGKSKPAGYYYWDNEQTSWRAMAATGIAWDTGGNAGTNAATNFIGTTDDTDLVFKRNNEKSGFIGFINTAFGQNALASITNTYSFNTAVGVDSQKNSTTGFANTSVGARSLLLNISGEYNTAFGVNSLYENIGGSYNAATGSYSLRNNTSGSSNVANGYSALENNTIGSHNTAAGNSALYANISGGFNTATGSRALYSNTTGNYNTAFGEESLTFNTTSNNNTATGYGSLYVNKANDNTANGFQALNNNTTGIYNTAIGSQALKLNTTGINNVATGAFSLANNKGSANTAIGYASLGRNTSGVSNTAIGENSGQNNYTGNRNVFLGYFAAYGNNGGNNNIAIGGYSSVNSNYNNSIAIGDLSAVSASNQARIGNSSTSSIGGFVNWSNFSDKRFKKDIQKNVPGLEFIKKLQPVTYHLDLDAIETLYKTPDSLRKKDSEALKAKILQTGFIAQDVEVAAKELNYDFSGVDAPKNENDFYGLRYAEFVVPLVKGMQEQQEIIEGLQKQNSVLEVLSQKTNQEMQSIKVILLALEKKIMQLQEKK